LQEVQAKENGVYDIDKVLRTAIEIEVNAIWRYNLKV